MKYCFSSRDRKRRGRGERVLDLNMHMHYFCYQELYQSFTPHFCQVWIHLHQSCIISFFLAATLRKITSMIISNRLDKSRALLKVLWISANINKEGSANHNARKDKDKVYCLMMHAGEKVSRKWEKTTALWTWKLPWTKNKSHCIFSSFIISMKKDSYLPSSTWRMRFV